MRNFKLLIVTAIVFSFAFQASAQKKVTPDAPKARYKETAEVNRCGTMDRLEAYYRENPRARIQAAENANRTGANLRNSDSYRLNAIVTIPVVTHIVLGNPSQITDADVDYFINRLNVDYAGLNPDSANAGPFLPLRGHSQIRFCRAKRTPGGLISNGVERKISATQANANLAIDPIKHVAQGGLDAWDYTSYLNIWVGIGNAGLLGYANFPGTVGAGEDGVFVAYDTYANNPCYTQTAFNLGRTGSHEVGHWLGLFHNWGDEAGCTGDDFRQLPGTCVLPAGLFNPAGQGNTTADIGDTPNQAGNTPFNCPTGIVLDACATAAPGKMYQNYMDYTADACYSMFTNKQVARMEWVIDNCRASLKTSLGCTPPAGFPVVDAGINSILSPGGSEYNTATCTSITYPAPNCPGSFIPRLSVTNFGTTTITSITATVTVGATTVTQTFTVNLISGASTSLVFAAQNLVTGANNISFAITAVNGSPDTYTANNTITTTATVSVTALPFIQDFVTTTFPPPNMTVFNPTGTNTWVRNAAGNGTVGSAFINNYNFGGAEIDDIRTLPLTPPANPTSQDSVIISFDLAHRPYSLTSATFQDTLKVLVSTDCGATFTQVYSRWNTSTPSLATGPVLTASYVTPASTDWRRERIAIGGSFLTSGPIIVAFRNVARLGNNIFLDNINVIKKVDRDLALSSIISPASSICSNTAVPQVIVTNNGAQAATGFRIGYQINGGTIINQTFTQTIAPNASATITLAAATNIPTGNNTFTAFVADLVTTGGTGDQQTGNDLLTKSFTVATIFPLPLSEGFEAATFPPVNWTIVNPNNNITWVRNLHGNNSTASAFIDNYSTDLTGQTDALQSPALRTVGTDSIVVSFDVAHRNYTGSNDILQVLVSTDCGNTFTSYYSKGGTVLATAPPLATAYTNPAPTDWRRERVSIPTAAVASGNVIVRFQNTQDFGNNIFLDNINITSIFKRDIQLLSINQPGNVLCTTNTTPNVTVRNAGVDTIRGFKVAYSIDNGAPVTTTITNVALAAGATQTLSLTPATLAVGTHTLKVYTLDPVTTLGTGDGNPANDTLSKVVSVVATQAAPLAEGFENPTFPPVGWAINNVDGAITWQRTISAARVGNASAYINNFNYSNNGSRDELYSPQITYTGVDSVSLSFDVAALTFSYPGSTAIPLDTLEVFVTNDCGTTLTSVYKKWGNELQTINDPNYPQTSEFIPNTRNQWRSEKIDLSAYVARSPLQLVFRNTTNYENNIFLDNINLATKTLPAQLKAQGYLIYPSPFTTSFTIQHYLTPTELRGVAVYNSVGQRVYAQSYGAGGASSFMQVDMSRLASGLYTVVLNYTNRTISQKIIKSR